MSSLLVSKLVVAYPSGNTTALIFDDDLRFKNRARLNAAILNAWKTRFSDNPEIEQCGFVTRAKDSRSIACLEMFGGEFCGNAIRSAVQVITQGRDGEGFIETSGSTQPLRYEVKDGVVQLQMPVAKFIKTNLGLRVDFEGISQLVIDDGSPRQLLTKILQDDLLGFRKRPAVGVTYYNPITKQASFCVWVKEVDTIFNETACGSGTAAIGLTEAVKNRTSQALKVIQPSGKASEVTAEYDNRQNKVNKVSIAGPVEILYQGEMQLGQLIRLELKPPDLPDV